MTRRTVTSEIDDAPLERQIAEAALAAKDAGHRAAVCEERCDRVVSSVEDSARSAANALARCEELQARLDAMAAAESQRIVDFERRISQIGPVYTPLADLRALGGQLGRNVDVDNAAIINAALLDRSLGGVWLPPGITEITRPIIWPSRTGGYLFGAGSSGSYGDAAFRGGGLGGASSRLVANFREPNQTMIQYQGFGGRIAGVALESYPLPAGTWDAKAVTPNRARIGIHVVPHTLSGMPSGKIDVRNSSFHDFPVGMLFGQGLDRAYEDADSFDGETAAHADQSVIENCWWRYPWSLAEGEMRTCLYFRTTQAINFKTRANALSGVATEFWYVERGGELTGEVDVNGECTSVLRTGKLQFNATTIDVRMTIDGSGGENSVGRRTSPLRMDRGQGVSGAHIKIGGGIKTAWSKFPIQSPQFLIRGAAKVTIEDFNGLVPGGIQLVGRTSGNTRNPALVSIGNSTAYRTNDFADLVDKASVSPYRLQWDNECTAAFAQVDGKQINLQPVEAGSVERLGDVLVAGVNEIKQRVTMIEGRMEAAEAALAKVAGGRN